MSAPPDLTGKRRLLLAAAAIVIVTLLAVYLLGTVLLSLGISLVIAYVLLPPARLLERGLPRAAARRGWNRGIAVSVIFVVLVGVVAGVLALVIPPTIEQAQQFIEEFPELIDSARATVEGWVEQYTEQIPADVRARIEGTLANAGSTVSESAWDVVTQTVRVVSGSFTVLLGLATAPVLVFYLMKDSAAIRSSISSPFPGALRPILNDVLDIADRTMGAYIRGQLTLGLVVGIVVTIGLVALGVPFSYVLGIVAGLTELVPIIGPWIGGAAGVLVTLALDPGKLPWVIALYLGVQLLENVLLVPRIQGDSLRMHPVAVIMVILIASHYFGLWGVILGPPLAAMVKDLAVYFHREWHRPLGDPAEAEGDPIEEPANPDGKESAPDGDTKDEGT